MKEVLLRQTVQQSDDYIDIIGEAMQRLNPFSLLVLDLLMLILRQTASSTYNAINRTVFWKC
jgi:hypothetical protein